MTKSVLEGGQALAIEDMLKTPYIIRHIAEMFPTRSMLGLPLTAGERKLGAALLSFNRLHHYNPEVIPISSGISGRAVRTCRTQFVRDVKVDPDFLSFSEDVQSEICIPLLIGDKVLGILNIETPAGQMLTNKDAELLSAFANQMMVAIDHAILFTETQMRAKKERMLLEATNDFIAALNEEAVLGAVARHMTEALDGAGCTISGWEPENDCVVTLMDYSTAAGAKLDSQKNVYFLADYPATRWVVEHRKLLYIRLDDPAADPKEKALLEEFGNELVLMLPLLAGSRERVYGIIELFGKVGAGPYS